MSKFCAICTDDVPDDALLLPLGKGNALVTVCADCDSLHPRDGNYSFAQSTNLPGATVIGNEGNRRQSRRTAR